MSDLPDAPAVVIRVLAALAAGEPADRAATKAAVKACLNQVAAIAPGRSVEIRVPPFAAVQAVAGATHRRGTPPALVQMDAHTLLRLAVGETSWSDAVDAGGVRASGERSNLSEWFPLYS